MAGEFCGVAGTPAASKGWGCVKMRIEPYLHLGIRVFSRIFVFPYGFGNTYGS